MNSKQLQVGVIEFSARTLVKMVRNHAETMGIARACGQYRVVDGHRLCYLEAVYGETAGDGIVSLSLSYGPDRWVITIGADETVWVS